MRLLVSVLLLLIGFGVGAEPADIVFRNGEIYTVNDVKPWVQALAVKNKRIVFAGDDSGAEKYIGTETEVIDLQGKMAMPGIHDAHIHMMSGGMDALGCSIPSGPVGGPVADRLKECAAKLEEGEWLVAGPFFSEQFPDSEPHRKYLDEIFPDRPVYLEERTGHNGLANTKALEIAGVDASTEAPEGGKLTRDQNGRLTGELVESATALVEDVIPPPTAEQRVEALRKGIQIANQYGITSIQEASANEEYLTALKQIEKDGDLSLNVKAHIVWANERHSDKGPAEIREFIDTRAKFQSEHIDPNGIKMWLDGTPTGPYFTQADLDPETGEPEWEYILIPPERLNDYVTEFDAMGMKVKMHVAGKGAAHVAIDAIEHARIKNADSTLRHELAHTSFVALSDMDRMRELNVIGEVSPTEWQHREPMGQPPQQPWQFRTLSNKGVLLTIGTDWSVTSTPNFFEALEGLLLFGDESLDLISALRAMTWHGAIAIGREEDMGTLQPGKLANLIVLDRNLFGVDPEKIGDTDVMMTVFEGQVVFEQ